MSAAKPAMIVLGCAAILAGCKSPSPPAVSVSVFGLWPEQPPLRYKPYDVSTGGNYYIWPKVDSTRPTLQWESFPRPADLAFNTNWLAQGVTAVGYDLRIWRGRAEFPSGLVVPAELVYTKEDLPNNFHRLERSLASNAVYFWTIRARFRLGGKQRATVWSRIASPEPNDILSQGAFAYPDARYYRFRTPK